ncbi:hypothetical protein ACFVU3_39765 [Streptomyces sp. NPDC058052]|uniref:hypothetical protein n=1 Tax=Streptomyces sp. NPDC058052 TaxID=3346316 RepID=UPI0036EBD7C2
MSDETPAPELDYPAVHNGLDFLRSVVELLDRDVPDGRSMKFAVLHLQAATEVLVKACLASIDWTQVFMKPETADEDAYRAADFQSCKIEDAIKRLRQLGVEIAPAEKGQITALARERNKLQHFGATLNAAAIEAQAGTVLEFLMRFIDEYLDPELDAADAEHLATEMQFVRDGVPRIRSYTTARMARLEPDLAPLKNTTLRCPDCGQWTLVADGGEIDCRLCQKSWEPATFPLFYAVLVLGHSWRDYRKTGQPADICPDCGANTLVDEAYLADAPEQQRAFCFTCSQSFTGLDDCIRCGRHFPSTGDDDLVCGDCWTDVLASD